MLWKWTRPICSSGRTTRVGWPCGKTTGCLVVLVDHEEGIWNSCSRPYSGLPSARSVNCDTDMCSDEFRSYWILSIVPALKPRHQTLGMSGHPCGAQKSVEWSTTHWLPICCQPNKNRALDTSTVLGGSTTVSSSCSPTEISIPSGIQRVNSTLSVWTNSGPSSFKPYYVGCPQVTT